LRGWKLRNLLQNYDHDFFKETDGYMMVRRLLSVREKEENYTSKLVLECSTSRQNVNYSLKINSRYQGM